MSDEAKTRPTGDFHPRWTRYLEQLEPLRPNLLRFCRQLTRNVWDGEDLLQDSLIPAVDRREQSSSGASKRKPGASRPCGTTASARTHRPTSPRIWACRIAGAKTG